MWAVLRGAWSYRYFIPSPIKTDIKNRFIRSRIGGIWMPLNIFVHVLIYAMILSFFLILSSLLSARLPELAGQPYGHVSNILLFLLIIVMGIAWNHATIEIHRR